MIIVGVLCTAYKLHDKNSKLSKERCIRTTRRPHTTTAIYRRDYESKEISRKEGSCPLAIYVHRNKKGNTLYDRYRFKENYQYPLTVDTYFPLDPATVIFAQ